MIDKNYASQMPKKNYWLYVLKLEQGKYYVGITASTPEKRLQQHLNGFMASEWTKKFKPTILLDKKYLGAVSKTEAEEYENKIVRSYIEKYGLNNVRGGDIRYRNNYVSRFGRYFTDESWKILTVIILLLLTIVTLILEKYR